MAKKITISVPNDLWDRMNKWRGSFNFSKTFQAAIEKRISEREKFLEERTGGIDMNAIVERLRDEKIEVEGDWLEGGKKDGFDWASEAHYSAVQKAIDMEIDDLGFPEDPDLREHFQNLFALDEMESCVEWNNAYRTNVPNEFGDLYIEGWQNGVKEFWNQIKSKI